MTSAARQRWVRRLIRLGISAVSLVFFAMHVAESPRFEVIDRIENYLYDVRVRQTMPGTIDERIVIVDIDEASQAELGQWPWPRDTLADIVDNLFDGYGIRVLGLDVLFAEAEETSAERVIGELEASDFAEQPAIRDKLKLMRESLDSNIRFAESLIARDVLTGFVFKDSLAPNEPEFTGVLPPPVIRAAEIENIDVPFVEAIGYAGNLPALQENAAAGGFFDSPLIDSDGVFRRTPLVQRYRGDLYPGLALAVTRLATGSPPVSLSFAGNDAGELRGVDLEYLRLGELSIPVNEQVAVFIPYRGRQGSFHYVSAKDVVTGSAKRDLLADKIVLLGASAAGLLDLRSTPVGQRYIGVEAHANLISGLLDGAIKQQPSYSDGLELSLLFLLGLLTALVLPRLAPITAFLFVVVLLAITMGSNLWMWSSLGLVVPLASLLSYTLIAALLQINYGFFVESRNKRHLSRIFGQYIPPALVEELDESGEEVSLEGESSELSVLFSDVRGFTTLSEGLDAKELTRLMNEFLTPITNVIQKNRGTIDKYMGDAVMAFWGAPLPDADHARHAVLTGLEMIRTVDGLGQYFESQGWPPVAIGVGVASGEMNVGNMGSEFRVAYTVMGDTVNLGSRLEGLTKQYGVSMIVSDGTMRLAPDIAFRELDLVRVKGKQEPVAIYEPIGSESDMSAEVDAALEEFTYALQAYRRQDWDAAERSLRKLKDSEDQLLYNVYLDRIGQFRQEPPPGDWDGVFEHLTK
ncbi:MAG: CHASE2 domain-containing protein [Woeseiaceae bacterium]